MAKVNEMVALTSIPINSAAWSSALMAWNARPIRLLWMRKQNRIINENRNQLERVKRLDLEIKEKEKILKELEKRKLLF